MKFSPPKITIFYKVIRTFLKELALSASIVVFIAFCPSVANAAGLFSSFISSISNIVIPPVSASITPSTDGQNSATMSLPAPAVNVNPNPALADDTATVSGDALTAEVGPDGTNADVDQATASSTQISVYVVRPGDNLSKIAALFGVSVNTILWANDLNSKSVVNPGDTLVILPMSGIQYVVKKGDTLQSIIKKYNADTDDVLQYNEITIDSPLSIGQTILIPDAELGTPQGLVVSTGKGVPSKSRWGAPGSNPAHDTHGPDYDSDYILPVAYATETTDLHGYNAVDLAAPSGTTIVAADAGTVIVARSGGWNGGYGNYVVISHSNGTQTLYAHMSKVLASVGQTVAQGQKIGLVGQTGEATGPHVHFEVRGARNTFSCHLLGDSQPDLSCSRIL